MPPSSDHHEAAASAQARDQPAPCAVLTISDSRTEQTDRGGPLIVERLAAAGFLVAARALVPDDPPTIRRQIETWLDDPEIRIVITTGGTGVSRRDTTIEVVSALLTVPLPGFGELFRMISYDQIGAAAMLSRAVAGLVVREPATGGDTFIFALPGSVNAVETAMTSLIVPQLAHLVWERRR